ncbi:ribonuclease HIII [Lysinibacillus capsici]|jgi:ribonuclease HIII|uniref:Ribonuclease HIII n=1 Tax=Lysinibacillus capsici TaxID=2115968 RepID=A0A2X0XZB1_9BACI|nr:MULTISPECIES: ribonuclease HIII [Lysinibacillus]MCT6903546.1 ribonuclease HIII [Lactobacillus sp.]AUS87870.1 ribonuclease HIII [Lysinibacillus sp. YS11]MCR6521258.1 ribonuclease HIII [Lysinibacillus capsici]MDP1391944.1 ribonuclease HIII [Lysinibacillus capsici]MDP1412420.1 ribonuclease HIII [Lysinibacillus capsici]
MANIVLSISTNIQKEVMAYYASHFIERKAPGVIFAAKLPDTAITMYKSGKLMFQGGGAEREAARWGTVEKTATPLSTIGAKGDVLPNNFATMSVLGSDETGTGDYFGPITVAAVYVPTSKIELMNELGVKDSKMLTDDYMRKIAPDLRAACVHSVLVLRNEKYNNLQAKGYSQGKMKAMMHNKALQNTLSKMAPEKPEFILIDQFAERGVYYNYLKNERELVQENVYFSTKAEQLHVAVATASILARAAFLKEMDRLSDITGLTLMKGASNKVDVQAARIWRNQGEEFLRSITKWHFANTDKARKMK